MSYNSNKPKYSHMNLAGSFKSGSRHNSGRLMLGRGGRRTMKPVKKCHDPKPIHFPTVGTTFETNKPIVPPGSTGWAKPDQKPKPKPKPVMTSMPEAPKPRAWKTPAAPQPRAQVVSSTLQSEREIREQSEFPTLERENDDKGESKTEHEIVTEEVQDLDAFDSEWANTAGGMDFDQPLFFDGEAEAAAAAGAAAHENATKKEAAEQHASSMKTPAQHQQQAPSSWADDEVQEPKWAENTPAQDGLGPRPKPQQPDPRHGGSVAAGRPGPPSPAPRPMRDRPPEKPRPGVPGRPLHPREEQVKPRSTSNPWRPRHALKQPGPGTVGGTPSKPGGPGVFEGEKREKNTTPEQEDYMKRMLEKQRQRFRERQEREEREERERKARIEAKLRALQKRSGHHGAQGGYHSERTAAGPPAPAARPQSQGPPGPPPGPDHGDTAAATTPAGGRNSTRSRSRTIFEGATSSRPRQQQQQHPESRRARPEPRDFSRYKVMRRPSQKESEAAGGAA
eukprot:CAMPEP_0114521774 /NCGR_PEP_ID=MMETSP0109-20121206/20369_1 /TAXON_ID=29199 /ORGANISM="Chlorarachnion reptans, Strain CCCM449" /LENGTH=506 /DNA_ID=CAMNT_0001702909 /DNA_START=293 /DNA_END=1811 /DNA_ORIENTATION=+